MEVDRIVEKNETEVDNEDKRKRERHDQAKPSAKKPKMVSRKKKPGFDSEVLKETSYYFKNGLRHVEPYYFTFTTHAKGRWVGRTVYDIFSKEFQAETPEYYEAAIQSGKVHVNGREAGMSTVVDHNDLVCHRVHRHEPPVTRQSLEILHSDSELVVVNKPSSIPIHPCGRYRHNSVLFILAKEHNLKNLHTVHRLDRLTSGLLILSKSLCRAQQLEVEIRERKVAKEYMCRVKGEFPAAPVNCEEPILVFSHKLGLSRVDPEGKSCSTHFTRLSYNGSSSVVLCRPKTGRMHQIRVHLQWLGHPIVNDPLYNHPVWRQNSRAAKQEGEGFQKVQPGSNYEQMEDIVGEIIRSKFEPASSHQALELSAEGSKDSSSSGDSKAAKEQNLLCEEDLQSGVEEVTSSDVCKSDNSAAAGSQIDPNCTECKLARDDPLPANLVMYLHALSYKGKGWSFSASMPDWANESFQT